MELPLPLPLPLPPGPPFLLLLLLLLLGRPPPPDLQQEAKMSRDPSPSHTTRKSSSRGWLRVALSTMGPAGEVVPAEAGEAEKREVRGDTAQDAQPAHTGCW